jgi:ABC-2 type transport system ATP-binding protein
MAEGIVAAIDIRELTRQFDGIAAVDRMTISIRQGEMFGLIGPNGAGKSTLIKMLTTLLPPTSGSAAVVGYDIIRQPGEVRRHIGYVPQLLSADGALTGYENMLLSARLYGIPRMERTARITRALARMGLTQVADHLVGHYSGGMIRRLEIAQNLLHRPKVLFLDEPTIGLDPGARETVWDHVRDLRNSFHTTIVVSSHHMEEIEEICDRVALIDRGRVVIIGSPAELKSRAGPGATLDDLFIQLVGAAAETEAEEGYGAARRARRAAREHG